MKWTLSNISEECAYCHKLSGETYAEEIILNRCKDFGLIICIARMFIIRRIQILYKLKTLVR